MSSLEEKLQIWIVRETSGLCEARMKTIPDVSSLCKLTNGKNKKIWKYVTDHVKSGQSVSRIKDILALRRRVQNEVLNLNRHSPYDISVTKRDVSKAKDKVQFLESSYLNTKTHVFNLKEMIKNINEENCIFSQKCAFLETAALNLEAKSKHLNDLVEKLNLLISIAFCVENNVHSQDMIAFKKQDISYLNNSEMCNNFIDSKIKDLIYFMSLSVEKKLFDGFQTLPAINLYKSISEVMNNILLVDFVGNLKMSSEDSLNSFEKEDMMVLNSNQIPGNHNQVSEQYLQMLKLDHVNSCLCNKAMLKKISAIPKQNEITFAKNFESKEQQEYVSIKIQNECLKKNIEYLQIILSEELNKKTQILLKNNDQKLQCRDSKAVMDEFYLKLGSLQYMLNTFLVNFSNIKNSLMLSNEFIHDQLCSCLNLALTSSDFMNSINTDCESSYAMLNHESFLIGLLSDHSFENLNFSTEVWEILKINLFQNRHLFCENLAVVKNESSFKIKEFDLDLDSFNFKNFLITLKSLSNKTYQLNKTGKMLHANSKEDCKGLKTLLDDWWEQKAQFIPKITYNGKTLKMWLSILHLLEDF